MYAKEFLSRRIRQVQDDLDQAKSSQQYWIGRYQELYREQAAISEERESNIIFNDERLTKDYQEELTSKWTLAVNATLKAAQAANDYLDEIPALELELSSLRQSWESLT